MAARVWDIAEKASPQKELGEGPSFFHGLIIAVPVSLVLWAGLIMAGMALADAVK